MFPAIVAIVCLLLASIAVGLAVFWLLQLRFPEPDPLRDRLFRRRPPSGSNPTVAQANKALNAEDLTLNLQEASPLEETLQRLPFGSDLLVLHTQSHVTVPMKQFLLVGFAAPMAVGLLGMLVLRSILPVFIPIVVPVLAVFWLSLKRNQRNERLLQQFPEALMLLSSSLRAGHSLQSALTVCSQESPLPLRDEIARLVNDLSLGLPLPEAMGNLLRHVCYLPDFQLFATAVVIQRETGGNLAEVLDQLSATIRERFKLQRQVATLTAQPRLTGYLLGGAPSILLVFLSLVFYSYVEPLYSHPLGNLGLVLALVLQIIGFFTIRRIMDIRL